MFHAIFCVALSSCGEQIFSLPLGDQSGRPFRVELDRRQGGRHSNKYQQLGGAS